MCIIVALGAKSISQELPKRFFMDARKTHKGIILTDEIFQLFEAQNSQDLVDETEAR